MKKFHKVESVRLASLPSLKRMSNTEKYELFLYEHVCCSNRSVVNYKRHCRTNN